MKFMIASRRSARLYEELLRWQRQFAGVSHKRLTIPPIRSDRRSIVGRLCQTPSGYVIAEWQAECLSSSSRGLYE